jgi:hypothetical protein
MVKVKPAKIRLSPKLRGMGARAGKRVRVEPMTTPLVLMSLTVSPPGLAEKAQWMRDNSRLGSSIRQEAAESRPMVKSPAARTREAIIRVGSLE